MKKRIYICEISSNVSYPRYYDVETSSAIKCARKFGRCEGGEEVIVYGNKAKTTILSCAWWNATKGAYLVAAHAKVDGINYIWAK